MGFNSGVKGYRLWCLDLKKHVISKDVTFDETSMLQSISKTSVDTTQVSKTSFQEVEFEKIATTTPMPVLIEQEVNEGQQDEDVSSQDEEEAHTQQPPVIECISISKCKRNTKRHARYSDYVAYALPIINAEIPESYKKAMNSSENIEWGKVKDEEMNSLMKNNTWELVQLPPSKRVTVCKWVYTKK